MTFEEIKEMTVRHSKNAQVCREGFAMLLRAEDFGEYAMVMQKYWSELVTRYREYLIEFFAACYTDNAEVFNRMGIYYNQSCMGRGANVLIDSTRMENDTILRVGNTSTAWVYGDKAIVVADGNALVIAHDRTRVILKDSASADLYEDSMCLALDRSGCKAMDRSRAIAAGTCYISACDDSKVYGHSWMRITTYGTAQCFAHCRRKITKLGSNEIEEMSLKNMLALPDAPRLFELFTRWMPTILKAGYHEFQNELNQSAQEEGGEA